MAYKLFVAGEEALAADVNNYLMSQTVSRFSTAAARTAGLTAPVLNQLTMRDDRPGVIERWNGAAWVAQSTVVDGAATANVVVTNASAAASQDLVNLGNQAFDGTPYLIEFFCPAVSVAPAAGAQVIVNLFDGAADLGYFGALLNPANGVCVVPMFLRRIITPTAGNHAFHATAWVAGGSTTFYAGAGTGPGIYAPMTLSIRKVI